MNTRHTLIAIGAAAALTALSPNYALAQQIEFTDPDIKAEYIRYPSPNGHGEVRGYLVHPTKAEGPAPGVVVVHENRGLNPYIEDVARRLAVAGYYAFAPDARPGRCLTARVPPRPRGRYWVEV